MEPTPDLDSMYYYQESICDFETDLFNNLETYNACASKTVRSPTMFRDKDASSSQSAELKVMNSCRFAASNFPRLDNCFSTWFKVVGPTIGTYE